MSAARMYERVLAGDPTWNGRFFTGVLTTGIYCLPSCKARKPKLENVRFFNTCEEARKAGASLIVEGERYEPRRKTFIYVNNRLEGNALATIQAMLTESA